MCPVYPGFLPVLALRSMESTSIDYEGIAHAWDFVFGCCVFTPRGDFGRGDWSKEFKRGNPYAERSLPGPFILIGIGGLGQGCKVVSHNFTGVSVLGPQRRVAG